ncbi:hypothetical protein [Sporolactobacillus pectinivorans]|uniref:hypothetical protein n=1 Tax=Sporolactobacillus pectinivorans TaxID=1591408 RepID=UPI000C257A72|nr:hypothetical protein [Sporolactobacillus pectinivorans]
MRQKPNPFPGFKICFFICLLAIISIVITGCSTTAKKEPLTTKKTKTVFVSEVVFRQASKGNSQTPSQTALHGMVWYLSNGRTVTPDLKDLVFNSTVGKDGFVVLLVPGTTYKWFNYVFLSYKNHAWVVSGYVDAPIQGSLSKNKRGLALPFPSYLGLNLDINSNQKVWVFENVDHFVIIERQKQYPVSLPGFKLIKINGKQLSIKSSGNTSTAVYGDEESMVTVAGNVKKNAVISLVKSLSPTTDPTFPYK